MTCPTGKKTFTRRRDAKRYLRRIQTHGVPVKRVYECPLCGGYHMTSQGAAA